MTNPYAGLPEAAFYRTAVADREPMQIGGLWKPKFPIRPHHAIVTAGSCFAQHIGRALLKNGYRWLDCEPAPRFLSAKERQEFSYGIFSFRTGNIYTAKMLLQWLTLAFEEATPRWAGEYWESDGRYFDPLRPRIEPDGFESIDELEMSRQATLAAIRTAVEKAQVFVFTMGLTESWRNRDSGLEYAMCPGTGAGQFDASRHEFHNHSFAEILKDMRQALAIMRAVSRRQKVLLTVSPVPLTATASGEHVLNATSHSKSILRAVAGQLASSRKDIDYFPSYELISSPPFRGRFFADNQRSVLPEGVDFVMRNFFADQQARFGAPVRRSPGAGRRPRRRMAGRAEDVRCEEELLDAFASR